MEDIKCSIPTELDVLISSYTPRKSLEQEHSLNQAIHVGAGQGGRVVGVARVKLAFLRVQLEPRPTYRCIVAGGAVPV